MNLLRSLLKPFNRRVTESGVTVERRGGLAKRLDAANVRLNNAVDELNQTVSMSRTEFVRMIERDRVSDVMHFDEFASRCEFQYMNGIAKCRNPEHPNICTGLEACGSEKCPRLQKTQG